MLMTDTEGAPICKAHVFDIDLWGDGVMLLSIPDDFDFGDEYYQSNGSHVLRVYLRDILQEYLENYDGMDGDTKGLLNLSNLLREYADKYEKEHQHEI